MNRRQWLRWAMSGPLGLGLPALFQAQAAQASSSKKSTAKIKACIFIFYYGGPSHLDSFDPKPDAPAEIRGEFQSIATSVPGVRLCEHLPGLARIMHKVALVRTMYHTMTAHDAASAEVLTGRTPLAGDQARSIAESQAFPSYGACLSYMWQRKRLPVCHAALPFVMYNGARNGGQTPGFLGSAYSPLQVDVDPVARTYGAGTLQFPEDVRPQRLQEREALLERLGAPRPAAASTTVMEQNYEKAFVLLRSKEVQRALDIEREPAKVRDRYGMGPPGPYYEEGLTGTNAAHVGFARNMRGQNLLLARRLVEAGVPFVNVYDFKQQGKNWDTHRDNFAQHRDHLLPPTDRGLAALIEDLDARGLLDTTLVVALGEFGRTPRISASAGRDHWPSCYTALLAGGGIHGGAIYGRSDKIGAYPAADPVSPGDLAATIFWRFGLDPATELHDLTGRPYRLAEGEPIQKLFTHPDRG
jgi:uncharacterized protein (DUF1501 family)